MAKKVLIISSSPRKGGNSDTLCEQFLLGAKEAGHQAEKIFLRDKRINYCTGCGTCVDKKGHCSQKDDMAAILEKMTAADVIVLATPIYFYTMCGQLKTFIDRCCSSYTLLTGKEFYYIMTAAAGESCMDRTIEEFRGFLSCLDGAQEKGVLRAGGVWNIGDIKNSPALKQALEMSKKI
jgi:multimeric flavodoxin WrbA